MLNWASFTDWFHKPFQSEMSLIQVVLLTGLVIIASVFWMMILSHLRKELT